MVVSLTRIGFLQTLLTAMPQTGKLCNAKSFKTASTLDDERVSAMKALKHGTVWFAAWNTLLMLMPSSRKPATWNEELPSLFK